MITCTSEKIRGCFDADVAARVIAQLPMQVPEEAPIPLSVWWSLPDIRENAWVRAWMLRHYAEPQSIARHVLACAAVRAARRAPQRIAFDPITESFRVLQIARELAAPAGRFCEEDAAQCHDFDELLVAADLPATIPANPEERIAWVRKQHVWGHFRHRLKPDVFVYVVHVGLAEAGLAPIVLYRHDGVTFTRPYGEFFLKFEQVTRC